MNTERKKIEGVTPATLKVAITFFVCVLYFVGEIYFWGSEYYVKTPPYIAMGFTSIILSSLAYLFLKQQEPERSDLTTYALLTLIGFVLFTYALIPRVNIITDSEGIKDYSYHLDENYTWQSREGLPTLNVYLSVTEYWQQYKPGDEYTFQLRKGGLGIWLVNMDEIYADQKRFYDCNDITSCMFTNGFKLSNDT
jgi:hypothetical protein